MSMFNGFFVRNLPLTRIKIMIARVLYYVVTIVWGHKPRIIFRKGIAYEVDLSEGIDLSLFLFGNFQRHITHSARFSLSQGAVIIDVGANFGMMSLQFARLAPEGRVYAFEPTEYALNKLKRNLSLNPKLASRVTVINSFVSSASVSNAPITAFSSWKVNGENTEGRHPVHLGSSKPTAGVGAVSLDDFCRREGIDKVDLIKIDTDGHEYDVLRGAAEVITSCRPCIIFEAGLYMMLETNISFSLFEEFLNRNDYEMFNAKSGAQVTFENHASHIPAKGTIDIIAIPQENTHGRVSNDS